MLNICNWLIIRMSNLLTEENKRMGKTRYLFKKIRNTKETCLGKMNIRKDRNVMDLTEAEDIKRVARVHRRTIQKKIFMTQIITMV